MVPKDKISIAVSACLIGFNVRYDGSDKTHRLISTKLCTHFKCVPICPEVSIGLAVPREPLHLIIVNNKIRMRGTINAALDVTDQIKNCAADFIEDYPEIGGFVFKSRSPSCGLINVNIYCHTGKKLRIGSGLFSTHLTSKHLKLPVIEDYQLTTSQALKQFILQVNQYVVSRIESS